MMQKTRSFRLAGLAFALMLTHPLSTLAQEESRQPAPAGRGAGPEAAAKTDGESKGGEPAKRLPAESVTRHVIDFSHQSLAIRATAGAIRINDPQGGPQAEVAIVSYQLEGADLGRRPVAFALNGGPGTASGWLHLGLLGPWRLPMAGAALSPSAPPDLVVNNETWLDFTDLVFIDPPGTGYSRTIGPQEQARRKLFSIDGDIAALAEVMRIWLETNHRLGSPKYIIGESYSGFRGPKLVRELQREQAIGIRGLVLISPALDFGFAEGANNPLGYAVRLPSFAAAARERQATPATGELEAVETYATGEYWHDFLKGENDSAAIERMAQKVAALSGLDVDTVRKLGGRINAATFRREFDRSERRIASAYDATVSGFDPYPFAPIGRAPDPLTDALEAPVSLAMIELVTQRLAWRPDNRYVLSNGTVNRNWDWGRGQPEAVSDLRAALAFDPQLRVLVSHGTSDLVTPYFASKLLLGLLPGFGPGQRLQLALHPGGHMHYTRDDTRRSLHEEARQMFEAH
jgi:carboxypeptidase C (cathepsin A)